MRPPTDPNHEPFPGEPEIPTISPNPNEPEIPQLPDGPEVVPPSVPEKPDIPPTPHSGGEGEDGNAWDITTEEGEDRDLVIEPPLHA